MQLEDGEEGRGCEGWQESRWERKGVCVCECVMGVGNADSTMSHGPL